ncbi:MAG: VWA domain-containing protein [Rubellimicrobium sp.]|nr:VWA domain-containing protein [Rubellimicrobium sp.]
MIDLDLIPLRPGFPVGSATSLTVLVRLSADASALPPEGPRPGLNIALVLDRSGSMSGRPLSEAKRCAKAIVERLGASDRLAVVAYDNTAETVFPSMPVRDRDLIKSSIDRIAPGGTTALHDGWHLGATQVARHLKAEDVSRVLLLSDGIANHGLRDPDQIASHCADLAASGITTSTYGLGLNFNEDLMSRMAQQGQGQAHYGQTAEDLMEPFQTEFDMLAALVARKVRLSLSGSPGCHIHLLNHEQRDAAGRIILPDLARAGDIWLLLQIDIAEASPEPANGGKIRVLSAELAFETIDGDSRNTGPFHLDLDPMTPAAHAAQSENVTVRARLTEIEAARLQERARVAAQGRDWETVDLLISEAEALAGQNEWVRSSMATLRGYAARREVRMFSKEARYKSQTMRSRMVARFEDSGFDRASEAQAPRYLRRKLEQGRRSSDED